MYAPEESYPDTQRSTSVVSVQCKSPHGEVLDGPVNVVDEKYARIENLASPYRWVLRLLSGGLEEVSR